MSQSESLTSGTILGPFRLSQRIGHTVWEAEDTRNGKRIAVKILTRQLPRDQARRDELVRNVRLGAALYHAFLVPVLEIVAAGDVLMLAMELVDGVPIGVRIAGKPLDREVIYRLTCQLAEVLRFLHGKNVIHGNINADSVMITPEGHVRLGGLNANNLLARREGSAHASYLQKENDIRSVAYMSPEQIAGKPPADVRSDVFSLGAVLYEAATGRPPFSGKTAREVAARVVEGQPPPPASVNPQVDPRIQSLIGRCVFKDIYQRFKDAKQVADEIAKLSPEAVAFATSLARRVVAQPGASEETEARRAFLFVADVANYAELRAKNPDTAEKAAARMQQILGEAAYLFNGQVGDPFGPRMVAVMPTARDALEAGRKGEFDAAPKRQGADAVSMRMILHTGPVTEEGGSVGGEGVMRATAALAQLTPGTLFLTEDFAREARTTVKLRDAGARGGMKFYTVVPAPEAPAKEDTDSTEIVEEAPPLPPKNRWIPAAALVAVLAIGGIGAFLWMRSREKPVAVEPAPVVKPAAPVKRKVRIDAFVVEGGDPILTDRANGVRLALMEIIRGAEGLELTDAGGKDVIAVGGQLRSTPAGIEMTPLSGTLTGPPTPFTDAASALNSLVRWVSLQTNTPLAAPASAEAANAYAEALAAQARGEAAKAEQALRLAVKADPLFLPAQVNAMKFFTERKNEKEAYQAARQVLALNPKHLEAAQITASGALGAGDLPQAFAGFAAIVGNDRNAFDVLNLMGRYAAAVGDVPRMQKAIARLRSAPQNSVTVHEPDVLMSAGKINAAAERYYDLEVKVPDNPALTLKIGRIAVLRRTEEIALGELAKLQSSDPSYGYHLLKAYIAAQKRVNNEATAELTQAALAARPGDDYWTSAAEVYAMLGQDAQTMAALEKAVERSEPGICSVGTNPLFAYLHTDERFQAIMARIAERQQQIKSGLALLPL